YVNHNAKDYDFIVSTMPIDTQLIAFAQNDTVRKKIHPEVWGVVLGDSSSKKMRDYLAPGFYSDDESNMRWMYNRFFKKNHVLIIMYAGYLYSQDADNFFAFAKEYKVELDNINCIYDDSGYPIYMLYSVTNSKVRL